ncbi:hypothetical protein AtNW77_Chr2g0227821 [Arabidopsis thaliana]
MDVVHVCVKVKPELQRMYWDRHGRTLFNVMVICDLNMNIQYHTLQFKNGPPPRNRHELFNRCHASLRSVIERTFGVWKKKWRIHCEFSGYNTHEEMISELPFRQ